MMTRSFSQYKNDLNIAEWGMRKAQTGGADLQDLRSHAQLESFRKAHRFDWRMHAFMIHVRAKQKALKQMQEERLRRAERRARELEDEQLAI